MKNISVVSTNYSSLDTFFDQISLIFKKWKTTETIPSYFELYTLIYIINYILHHISISSSLESSLFSLLEVIIISSKFFPTIKVQKFIKVKIHDCSSIKFSRRVLLLVVNSLKLWLIDLKSLNFGLCACYAISTSKSSVLRNFWILSTEKDKSACLFSYVILFEELLMK